MNQNIIDQLREDSFEYGYPYEEIFIAVLAERGLIKEDLTDEEYENLSEVIYG